MCGLVVASDPRSRIASGHGTFGAWAVSGRVGVTRSQATWRQLAKGPGGEQDTQSRPALVEDSNGRRVTAMLGADSAVQAGPAELPYSTAYAMDHEGIDERARGIGHRRRHQYATHSEPMIVLLAARLQRPVDWFWAPSDQLVPDPLACPVEWRRRRSGRVYNPDRARSASGGPHYWEVATGVLAFLIDIGGRSHD